MIKWIELKVKNKYKLINQPNKSKNKNKKEPN